MYIFGQDNKFRQILQPKHVSTILQELHGRVAKGHFYFDIIMRKILDAGYWWPTMNQDVYEYCRTSDQCQRIGNLLTQNFAKLVTTLPKEPFQKWGLDFIGLVKPISRLSCN
jgi:hypothetical protein